MSICTIEDVRAATKAPFWFQLYVFRDRGFSEEMIERAQGAGCSALFVTVDLPMRGQRHCDLKNGLDGAAAADRAQRLRHRDQAALGRWRADGQAQDRSAMSSLSQEQGRHAGPPAGWANDNFDQSLSAGTTSTGSANCGPASWCSRASSTSEDAKRAAAVGVDAIVVSNHGGRQLDGAPARSPRCRASPTRCGDRIEVLFDGGIRSGQDVLKALALGARGCLIGRAYLYGLAAMGEAGVAKALTSCAEECESPCR